MRNIALGFAAVISAALLTAPAFAQKVTAKVTNQFNMEIIEYDNTCLSVECPVLPTPIASGATSEPFTAEPATDAMSMIQVTYGALSGKTSYACRFRAETAKAAPEVGGCLEPVAIASVYSGTKVKRKAETPTCRVVDVNLDAATCDLSVTFEMAK